MPSIVNIAVSLQVAPTPDALQKTGAAISQGGTSAAAGTVSFITQLSDLTPLYTGSKAITSISWTSGTATVTTTSPHGFTNADTIDLTIVGATPTGYNGTYFCTITGASTFTFPLASNPGAITVPGSYTPEDVAELCAMATTFFAQGNNQAMYVLELGAGTAAEGVTALSAFITANANLPPPAPGTLPYRFYSYLVPRVWAGEPTFHAFAVTFNAPSASQYFFVTATLGTIVNGAFNGTVSNFTALDKSCIVGVEAPGIPVTEFSMAALWRASLAYRPSSTNRVTPFAFEFVYGVTPYPVKGNSVALTLMKTMGVNYIGTGAEGGISNTIILWGTTMDLNDFTFWYSCDWMQINIKLSVANAIINGSNNPINPLYYDQQGINVLQGVIASVFSRGVSFGLVLGAPVQTAFDGPALQNALDAGAYPALSVVNAVPFITYSNENPGDYKIGVYSGFSGEYTPKRGFTGINFNLTVSDFVTAQ